jgi:hypothetical protein
LGNALGFELVKAEAEKSAHSKNPDAIDLAMRGWAMMWQSYPQPMKEKEVSHNAALALFDQALKIDPNKRIARRKRASRGRDQRVHGNPVTVVTLARPPSRVTLPLDLATVGNGDN